MSWYPPESQSSRLSSQELAAEHLARVRHEGLEQPTFHGSEMMHSIVSCNQPAIQVQGQSVDL